MFPVILNLIQDLGLYDLYNFQQCQILQSARNDKKYIERKILNLQELYEKKDIRHNGAFAWRRPVISFEVFPPKDDVQNLYNELEKLKAFDPAFVSLTCNAGGGDNSSMEIANHIKRNLGMDVMPHLTCVCNSQNDIGDTLSAIEDMGAQNVLALRGDLPEGGSQGDFKYASELVEFVKTHTELNVGVAGYPEGHIDAPDLFADIENLKKKIDAGAQAIFTQLFFNNDKFFSYVQLVRDAGILVPIIPGIMPIISKKQIEKMTALANISVPETLLNRIEKYKDNPVDMKKLGVDFASYQCQQLIDAEVPGLHFYTLNRAHSTSQILENIT